MTMTAKRRQKKQVKRTRAKRDAAIRRGDMAVAKGHEATLLDWELAPSAPGPRRVPL